MYQGLFDRSNDQALPALKAYLAGLTPQALLVVEIGAGFLKSVGLTILMLSSDIDVRTALHASRLEDRFQYEAFGKVEEFHLFEETELYMKLLTLKLFWRSLH